MIALDGGMIKSDIAIAIDYVVYTAVERLDHRVSQEKRDDVHEIYKSTLVLKQPCQLANFIWISMVYTHHTSWG